MEYKVGDWVIITKNDYGDEECNYNSAISLKNMIGKIIEIDSLEPKAYLIEFNKPIPFNTLITTSNTSRYLPIKNIRLLTKLKLKKLLED